MARLRDHHAKVLIAERLFRLARGTPGDTAPLGNGISELRIHFGPGYRLYYLPHGKAIVVLLCGGTRGRKSETYDLRSNSPVNGDTIMAEKFTPYDFAEVLNSIEAIELFMAEASSTRDAAHIAAALGVVAHSKGMIMLTARSGISQDELDRLLVENDAPTLETVQTIMNAIGIHPATASDSSRTS